MANDQPRGPESKVIRDFKEALAAQHERSWDVRIRLLLIMITAIAATITGYSFARAYGSLTNRTDPAVELMVRTARSEERLLALERNVNELKKIDRQAINSTTIELSEDAARRLGVLEDAVLDNPEKALNLVLVRREVAELRSAMTVSESATQREFSRVYDLTKIAVGAIFAMVLGVLGLTLTQLLSKKTAAQVEGQGRGNV